ncbi:MAG: type II secretion system F family protein [Candidatus Omnitrophica bacterium]|nr:type II secretion system F family protein [Candidatus Omnitrophota bacterium]
MNILILIYLFFGLGITAILVGILRPAGYSPERIRLSEEQSQPRNIKIQPFLAGISPITQRILATFHLDQKIKDKLDAAHTKLGITEFFNLKLAVMALAGIAGIFIIGKFDPLVFLGGLGIGYVIPELWLNRKIAKRKYEIVRVLPETVDLLGLCVEAGLDFTAAVRWVVEKIPANPMIEELSFILEEIRWGKSRTQALKDMSRRLNISEITSFVQTLVQAERMGTPVAEAFMILSEDSRLQRFHRGERIALQAPIKILIPLIFCILPVITIVIGGPILLQFMQGKLF